MNKVVEIDGKLYVLQEVANRVFFKKLIPQAHMPERASEQAAGYDLRIPETIKVSTGRRSYPLGFAIELPVSFKADIDPRSGSSSKGMEGYLSMIDLNDGRTTRFDADVVHGMVDSDYRGTVGVIINNRSGQEFLLKAGTRIAQMVITRHESVEFVETDKLSDTKRGTNGFGSTGTK